MQKRPDIVRAKVDNMRTAGGTAKECSRAEVVTALVSEVADRAPVASADAHRGAVHMCPWHTCQATRH